MNDLLNLNGSVVVGESGRAISFSSDGSVVAIGASGNDGGPGNDGGHVRIYQWRQFTQTDHDNSIYHYTSRIQSAYENQEKPLIELDGTSKDTNDSP